MLAACLHFFMSLPVINFWTHNTRLWNRAVVTQTLFYQRLEGSASTVILTKLLPFLVGNIVYALPHYIYEINLKTLFSLLFFNLVVPHKYLKL